MEQYFVNNEIIDSNFKINDSETFKHIVKVLRHQIGDVIYLVDPTKNLFTAKIAQIDLDNKELSVEVDKLDIPSTEMPVSAIVACSLSKKDKVEWITQKSTELGASKIIFFASKYSIMHWKNNVVEKKLARLQEIAKNAAQQSKRRIIPEVIYLNKLSDLLKYQVSANLVAYEESAKVGEISLLAQTLQKKPESVLCAFGPEGGFAPDEIEMLNQNGFLSVGLGPRIMRAETAPTYFLSVLSYKYELTVK
ncbi:RsmE family RNA methyltransferase [Companilactobacillus halodurans]|uniref:Ribosomal RNA small subunit methyltransferase E n=1 Tax=Companilactobacillus halodurans TaxID=2584183 RepID=A0A5P0ZPF4_9LACO|nr:RsmE family RNA methyltransferase [Companilactobacillus halodurans]MQS76082.1 16S rRNA (uracil(1498)-N(3))-methyltransferase [Companilactobacillus halodurans]MQS96518.1 16S rRNA (uracil(1498)-N(3))-methyltransferase [Companilactobacillus halodurans]